MLGHTRKELLERARTLGIVGRHRMNKEDLGRAIARKAGRARSFLEPLGCTDPDVIALATIRGDARSVTIYPVRHDADVRRSLLAWSSTQYLAAGLARSRAGAMWRPQSSHVPYVPASTRSMA